MEEAAQQMKAASPEKDLERWREEEELKARIEAAKKTETGGQVEEAEIPAIKEQREAREAEEFLRKIAKKEIAAPSPEEIEKATEAARRVAEMN